jgi:hypothetical protein
MRLGGAWHCRRRGACWWVENQQAGPSGQPLQLLGDARDQRAAMLTAASGGFADGYPTVMGGPTPLDDPDMDWRDGLRLHTFS